MNYAEYKKQTNHDIIESVKEIIKIEGLSTKSSRHCLTNKRQYLIWFLKENTGDSFSSIGEMFNLNHSSSLKAHYTHCDFIEFNNEMYVRNIKVIQRYLKEKFPKAINVELN